jgi:hypothetical protein
MVLLLAERFDVGCELVERHRPSGRSRGVAGYPGVGHDHLGVATEVFKFDAD